MVAPRSDLWNYFWKGGKQNTSHFKAYCYGCIKHHRPNNVPINLTADEDGPSEYGSLAREDWFAEGMFPSLMFSSC
jgi:hypothetical protein